MLIFRLYTITLKLYWLQIALRLKNMREIKFMDIHILTKLPKQSIIIFGYPKIVNVSVYTDQLEHAAR